MGNSNKSFQKNSIATTQSYNSLSNYNYPSSNNLNEDVTTSYSNIFIQDKRINQIILKNSATINYSHSDFEDYEKVGFFDKVLSCLKHRQTSQLALIKWENIHRITYKNEINEQGIQKLLDDIDLHRQLSKSENFVQFYGVLMQSDSIGVCIEPMDISLKELYPKFHKKEGNFDEDLLGFIAVSMINAANYAHENFPQLNIDICPETIFINTVGQIKLGFFDIAHKPSILSPSLNNSNTNYWPSERFKDVQCPFDERENVWSLGITLVEILLNKFPFEDDKKRSPFVFANRIMNLTDEEICALLESRCDHSTRDFICVCLNKDPIKRPTFKNLTTSPLYNTYYETTSEFVVKQIKKLEVEINNSINLMPDNTNLMPDNLMNMLQFPNSLNIYDFNFNNLVDSNSISTSSMSKVESYLHKPSKNLIAIKFLRIPGNRYDRYSERIRYDQILKEAMIHRKLSKLPGIINFYGIAIHADRLCIAMELMDLSLRDFYSLVHKCINYMPEKLLGNIGQAILTALVGLKSFGVMHRDIKPHNILVNFKGEIKLADFGTSRILDNSLASTQVGTIAYWPPEHFNNAYNCYDIRSDIWSFGITLIEAITGKMPYDAKEFIVLQQEIQRTTLTELMEKIPKFYSSEANEFLKSCLERHENRMSLSELAKSSFYRYYRRTANSSYLSQIMLKLEKIKKGEKSVDIDFLLDTLANNNINEIENPTSNESDVSQTSFALSIQDNDSGVTTAKLNVLYFPFSPSLEFDLSKFKRYDHKCFGCRYKHDTGKVVRIEEVSISTVPSITNQNYILKEIEILQKAQLSPYILEFYGLSIKKTKIFICTELMEMNLYFLWKIFHSHKESLNSLEYSIPEEFLGHFIVAIINGLGVLHSYDLINLGITTKNIFLNRTGEVKLGNAIKLRINDNTLQSSSVNQLSFRRDHNKNKKKQMDICHIAFTIMETITGKEHSYDLPYPSDLAKLYVDPIVPFYSNMVCEFLNHCLSSSENELTHDRLEKMSLYEHYAPSYDEHIIAEFVYKYEEIYEHSNMDLVKNKKAEINQPNLNDSTKSDAYFNAKPNIIIFPEDENKFYDFKLDNFSRLDFLGDTSSSSVFKYQHIATGKYVAIKSMKVPQTRVTMTIEDARLVKKAKFLKQEIETHRQFNLLCPYIVAFYGFATINNEVLICMELMGMSLEDLNEFIHRSDHNKSDIAVFPEKLLVVIGKSILNGLMFCNKKGIIHRDIKPKNILINEKGEIKLCDFGRSRFLENGHATTSEAGTIAYWPPERIPGHSNSSVVYDIRSDTWSLGITLAELICGKYPIVDKDGYIPQGEVNLMRCIRIVKGNEICERCFGDKYPEYIKDFAELCLEELSKRPKFDQLVQTKFYECFNELLEETNAYVATFVRQKMDFEENEHTTKSSSSTLINS